MSLCGNRQKHGTERAILRRLVCWLTGPVIVYSYRLPVYSRSIVEVLQFVSLISDIVCAPKGISCKKNIKKCLCKGSKNWSYI